MKKNEGYTFVEVLIVMAIMLIVSAMAFVTLGVIHQAKYNAAANTINNQMSSLWIQTKSISQPKEQATGTSAKDTYPLCMLIEHHSDETFSMRLGYDKGTGFEEANTGAVTATLPKIIELEYIPKDNAQKHGTLTDFVFDSGYGKDVVQNVLIEFNKSDGSVKYGAGQYNIIYKDDVVASIYLDSVTGKHYFK